MSQLNAEFAMKDLWKHSSFLGIDVTYHSGGLFLSQKKYAEAIIACDSMASCKPSAIPIETKSKWGSASDLFVYAYPYDLSHASSQRHCSLHLSLSVRPPPASTEGVY
ncbi:hypothetical protein LIER_43238 [Lithospermum erythrorhizon]|uniref:Reverse transcriptase Ty1/copia-type domain-containing protein n=1 Tax=Lithospermum erythrorhizon TaxID=34254 RepID=A0AAV3PP95_LITER